MYMSVWIKIEKERKRTKEGYQHINRKYCVTMDKTELPRTRRWFLYFCD